MPGHILHRAGNRLPIGACPVCQHPGIGALDGVFHRQVDQVFAVPHGNSAVGAAVAVDLDGFAVEFKLHASGSAVGVKD